MKYEEIKVGDVYKFGRSKEEVIAKVDKIRLVLTVDNRKEITTWKEDELYMLEPIKEKLPEEGLLVHKDCSLVYKLSDGSGYGFFLGRQSNYSSDNSWNFSSADNWKPATPDQKKKFVEMLKIECEKRELFEDTNIEAHADGSGAFLNTNAFKPSAITTEIYNKNGQIFHKGKFATPLEETTLELVSKAVKEIGNFTIEQTESGLIILTPINK